MRIGGDGGWGAITGNTYQIKTMAVPRASASGMKASEIEALFSYLDPSAVAEAGRAHTAAAKTLHSIADSLVKHAQVLASGWSGTAAQSSITSLRQLHGTALELAQASARTGQVLTWLGETILPYYKNWKAPSNGIVGTVESWFGSNPQDHAARQVMERLNDRLNEANESLPASITFDAPKIGGSGPASPPAPSTGFGPVGGVGAAVASSTLTGSPNGAVNPAGSGPGGVTGVTSSGSGPGGSLSTVPTVPTAPGGGHALPPTQLAGGVGGGPPGVGGAPGPGGGLPGSGLPGGGAPGGGLPGGGLSGGPAPIGPVPGPGQGGGPGAGGGVGRSGGPGEGGGAGEGGAPGEGGPPGEVGVFPGGSGPGAAGGYGEAVIGSDGMLGTGPGMAEGEFRTGNAGATGFIGADDGAAQSGSGFPIGGGSAGGGRENDRYRQSWMPEDLETWEGKVPG